MNLDDELKSALSRREPPAGFAEGVIARARGSVNKSEEPARSRWLDGLWSWRNMQWVAATAAVTALLIGAGGEYRRRQEGERAKEQVIYALRMAGSRLGFAQRLVLEMSSGRTEAPDTKVSTEGERQ